MTNVFISYAREDREKVSSLARLLEEEGHSVWWDWNLIGGAEFRQEIRKALDAATKVIVVWSPISVTSAFVIDEASEAKQQRKLIPISFDETAAPLGFGDLHMIPLKNINNDLSILLAALENRPAPAHLLDRRTRPGTQKRQVLLGGGVLVAIAALGLFAYFLMYHGNGCTNVAGSWRMTSGNSGSSIWNLTPRGTAIYTAREVGLGNASGTAVLIGRTLRIDWSTGSWAGSYQWNLDKTCSHGDGKLVYTQGDRAGQTDITSVSRH